MTSLLSDGVIDSAERCSPCSTPRVQGVDPNCLHLKPAHLLVSCVSFGELFDPSVRQFAYLQNRAKASCTIMNWICIFSMYRILPGLVTVSYAVMQCALGIGSSG